MITIRARILAAVSAVTLSVLGLGAAARADVDSVTIGSAAVPPGATVGVEIIATATDPGVGAWTIDVEYDADLLTLKECRPADGLALCNPDFGERTVRFAGASAEGVKGSAVLGGLTFVAGETEGAAKLHVSISQLADPGGKAIKLSPTDGVITIKAGVTPSIPATSTGGPEGVAPGETGPAPEGSGAESSPGGATSQGQRADVTGGVQGGGGSGGSDAAAWLLGGAGLAIVAGGVWAATRMRKRG